MGTNITNPPAKPSDVKVLAQGTFTHTGNGAYQDIATVTTSAMAEGDMIVIEYTTWCTGGVGATGAGFHNATGNASTLQMNTSGNSTLCGTIKLMRSTTSTKCAWTSAYTDNATWHGDSSKNEQTTFDFSAATNIYLKTSNAAAATNQIIKYIVYEVSTNAKV